MTCSRNMWLFLVAGIQFVRGPVRTSAAESPCPDVFQFIGSPGSEYGIITLPNPYPYLAIDLRVSIYVSAPVSSIGSGKLNPVDNDIWRKLAAGSRDPVFYRLDFPVSSPLPTIKTIKINNNVICTGSKPNAEYVNTVTLQHAIYNKKCNSASLDCPLNIQHSAQLRPQPSPNSVSPTGPERLPPPPPRQRLRRQAARRIGIIQPAPKPPSQLQVATGLGYMQPSQQYAVQWTAARRRGSLTPVSKLQSQLEARRIGSLTPASNLQSQLEARRRGSLTPVSKLQSQLEVATGLGYMQPSQQYAVQWTAARRRGSLTPVSKLQSQLEAARRIGSLTPASNLQSQLEAARRRGSLTPVSKLQSQLEVATGIVYRQLSSPYAVQRTVAPIPVNQRATTSNLIPCAALPPKQKLLPTSPQGTEQPAATEPETKKLLAPHQEPCRAATGPERLPAPPRKRLRRQGVVTTCGVADVISNALIVNGQDTTPGEWPWHAALYLQLGTDIVYLCGGSLIGTRTIITTAHCVTTTNGKAMAPEDFVVALGRYDLTRRKEEGSQEKDVQQVLPHPAYNHRNFNADVALLILNSSVQYTRFVRPVCLWSPSDTSLESVVGMDSVVVGWGKDENGLSSQKLKMAITSIVSMDTCYKQNEEYYMTYLHTNAFCAGFANGTSICTGEVGGGLVIPVGEQGESKAWKLRGIVSNIGIGDKSCDPNSYTIFTDVAQYLPWISANTI